MTNLLDAGLHILTVDKGKANTWANITQILLHESYNEDSGRCNHLNFR